MTDWTTKGLFSALVLIAGLGFGRQIIRSWRGDEPPVPTNQNAAAIDGDRQPTEIALGDIPVRFGRQTVVGDRIEAAEALRAACLKSIASASPWSPSPDADEQRLLTRLARRTEFIPFSSSTDKERNEFRSTARHELPAGARLYESALGMPLIVGTRRIGAASNPTGRATERQERVVLWGLAAPRDEQAWTLFLFQVDGPAAIAKAAAAPLPPGCQRLMSVARGGEEVLAFQGQGGCDEYRRFYVAWQAKHWPQAALHWQRSGGGWQASLVSAKNQSRRPETSGGQAAGPLRSWLIQLTPGRFGGCTGLVFVTR